MDHAPRLIRFKDLHPSWAVPRATEPGFMRWLVNWLGGSVGFVNFNPGVAADSVQAAMGFMAMPQGNRQAGLHIHSVTEIYLILQGEIEGFDHTGHSHVAGPLDCVYIPPGVPHGVRTCGTQDLHLIWVHDALEPSGASVYVDHADPSDSAERIRIVRAHDLDPYWGAARAREGGHLRWSVTYVGGPPGFVHRNRGVGAENPLISLGMTWILPGNCDALAPMAHARTLILVRGAAVARLSGGNAELSYLDAVHVPAGHPMGLRAFGDAPAALVWLVEGSAAADGTGGGQR